MIFSLTDKEEEEIDFSFPNADIFCFFLQKKSIKFPLEHWPLAAATSLRIKQEVLILENPIRQLPDIDKAKRWQIGEGYLWLAPRALSVFSVASHEFSGSYDSIKKYLISVK